MKIIITGASGFIGTNVLEHFKDKGYKVFNLDIYSPRNKEHKQYWQKVDLCDFEILQKIFEEIRPMYVIHLAAKTNLNEKDGLEYYNVNLEGVENIVKLCTKDTGIRRVIFASSMLVNEVGYKPKNLFDYNPQTTYGKSKVLGEKIILENKDNLTEFCIIRPTSIWGEWFAEPYKNFFDFVLSGKFFYPGNKASIKTFGYIGNTVYQIEKLLFEEFEKIQGQVFYIGDKQPLNIAEFAIKIALKGKAQIPIKIPVIFFRIIGLFGDLLHKFQIKFPINSFRLKNMTTNNIVNLEETYNICGNPPFDLDESIERTISWITENKF